MPDRPPFPNPPHWPENDPDSGPSWKFTRHRPFMSHPRPAWWPENEPWPPRRGHLRHNPFFRRLGCMFAIFNLLGLTLLAFVAALVAHLFGLIHITPRVVEWT